MPRCAHYHVATRLRVGDMATGRGVRPLGGPSRPCRHGGCVPPSGKGGGRVRPASQIPPAPPAPLTRRG